MQFCLCLSGIYVFIYRGFCVQSIFSENRFGGQTIVDNIQWILSGDAYCFETLGNDEYETRWCFFYAKNISYFWCINVFVQLFEWLKDLRNSFPSCGVLDENACIFSKCFERLDLRKLRPLWEPPTADHLHKLGWHRKQSIMLSLTSFHCSLQFVGRASLTFCGH